MTRISNENGFTLIEALLVVTILGIVSGIALLTINVQRQKDIAQDGIVMDHVQKASEAIESFRAMVGSYPIQCADPNPELCVGNEALADLISVWPTEVSYITDGTEFAVFSGSLAQSNTTYKYSSDWTSSTLTDRSIQECGTDATTTTTVEGCSAITP